MPDEQASGPRQLTAASLASLAALKEELPVQLAKACDEVISKHIAELSSSFQKSPLDSWNTRQICSLDESLPSLMRAPASAKLPPLPAIASPSLAKKVFTHSSAAATNYPRLSNAELLNYHNDRLEFLGDSVLNHIVTLLLYKHYPHSSAGDMSSMRQKLVCNETLSHWSKQYGFGERLEINKGLAEISVKVHADTFEAYLGALFEEASSDKSKLDVILKWIWQLAMPLISDLPPVDENALKQKHLAKQELNELLLTDTVKPEYLVVKEGSSLDPWTIQVRLGDTVLGVGSDTSKNLAGNQAAAAALSNTDLIDQLVLEKRTRTGHYEPRHRPRHSTESDAFYSKRLKNDQ